MLSRPDMHVPAAAATLQTHQFAVVIDEAHSACHVEHAHSKVLISAREVKQT